MGNVKANLMESRLVEAVNCGKWPGMHHHTMLLQFDRHPEETIMSSSEGCCLVDLERVEAEVPRNGYHPIQLKFPNDYLTQSNFGDMIRKGVMLRIAGNELLLNDDIYESFPEVSNQHYIAAPVAMLTGPAAFLLTPEKNYEHIANKRGFVHLLSDFVESCFFETIHFTLNTQTLSSIQSEAELFKVFVQELNKWLAPHSYELFDEKYNYFADTTRHDTPFSWKVDDYKVDFFLPRMVYLSDDQALYSLRENRHYPMRERAFSQKLDKHFELIRSNWKNAVSSPSPSLMKDAELLALIQTRLPHWRRQLADEGDKEVLPEPDYFFGKRGDNWIIRFRGEEVLNTMSNLQGLDTIRELLRNPSNQVSPPDLYYILERISHTYNKIRAPIPERENEKISEEDLLEMLKAGEMRMTHVQALPTNKKVDYLYRRFGLLNALYTYPSRKKYAKQWSEVKRQLDQLGPIDPQLRNLYKQQYKAYERCPVNRYILRTIQSGVERVLKVLISPKNEAFASYLLQTLILKTLNNDKPLMFDPKRAQNPELRDVVWETGDI